MAITRSSVGKQITKAPKRKVRKSKSKRRKTNGNKRVYV